MGGKEGKKATGRSHTVQQCTEGAKDGGRQPFIRSYIRRLGTGLAAVTSTGQKKRHHTTYKFKVQGISLKKAPDNYDAYSTFVIGLTL